MTVVMKKPLIFWNMKLSHKAHYGQQIFYMQIKKHVFDEAIFHR